jgi:MFS transporter, CP family, cyanate transporter
MALAEEEGRSVLILNDGASSEVAAFDSTEPRQIGAPLAITAIILVALGLRPSLVSVGPILPLIIDAFGLSHAQASLLTSIPDLLMGVFALPAPWLARRLGRDLVLLFALALLAAATVGRAFSFDLFTLLTATAGVGIGIAVAGALIAGFIKARFAGRAALLMGVYGTALSAGSTVSAAATGPMATLTSGGWRFAAGIWSVVVLIGLIAWLVVTVSERRIHGSANVAGGAEKLPVRNAKAWLVALFFACVNLLFYSVLTWTVPMYQESGVSAGTAGLILATFTAVFTVANVIFGWLSRDEDRRGWLALSAGLALVGLSGIALAPTLAPFVWISIFAFGLGGAFALGMTLPLDNTKSVSEANAWNAFVLMIGYVIAACGPLMVGRVRDVSGSFTPAYWLLAGIAFVMLAVTPLLRPKREVVR